MDDRPQHLRIFLSSPGDVRDERGVALSVIDRLQYDPLLRGRVTFEAVAWDQPGSGTPMLATMTPQAAIDVGLSRPSECDIVVVIFWSRMGTPLPYPDYQKDDGEPYYSGTEWEFADAMRAARAHGRPEIVVYRRTEKVLLDDEAADFQERLEQKRRVRDFFVRFQDPKTGSIIQGYNQYQTTDDFRQQFEVHLKTLTKRIIERAADDSSHGKKLDVPAVPLWQGSPFPGLRSFTPIDAPIFFGRGRETDELLRRIAENRFVAVVGASGSGKSSLVAAGALPRLADGAIPSVSSWVLPSYNATTRQWDGLRFTPAEVGDNPFLALAVKLAPLIGRVPRTVAAALTHDPTNIGAYFEQVLADHPPGSEMLMFIDQFEELFAVIAPAFVLPFVALLETVAQLGGCRVAITMRSDFYHRSVDIAALARLLEYGQFPLAGPTDTLLDMIVRPAERAGLQFEEGLPGRILADTQQQPGALPLLAYTLDELYEACAEQRVLSHAAYDALGGVHGAIGTRAEDVFCNELDDDMRAAFSRVFRELVEVNDRGQVTRRRPLLSHVATDAPARSFVDVFTEARLFVQGSTTGRTASVVEVAHEALFRSWPRLREWIEIVQDDLRLLQKVSIAAQDWHDHGHDEAYLWPHERLEPVYAMLERLAPSLDDNTGRFLRPEHERLFPVLTDPQTEEFRRQATADRLLAIGEVTLPGLFEALRNENLRVRATVTATLIRFGLKAIPGLEAALDDPDPNVRLSAVGALRAIDGAAAVPGLLKALRDADLRVRSVAAGALKAIESPDAAAGLAAALQDVDVDVRWRAAGTLGAFGEAAVPALIESLSDQSVQVRTAALDALKAIGETAVPQLLDALRDVNARTRHGAAEALVAVGPAAVPGLLVAQDDGDADVRWRAADTLLALRDRAAVPALVVALKDVEAAVRRTAAAALRAIGDPAALLGLRDALDDEDIDVQWTVGEALSAIGAPAVPALLAVLSGDRPAHVRAIAAAALGSIGEPALPALCEALQHGDADTRDWIGEALVGLGSIIVPSLLDAARTTDDRLRRVVVDILGRAGEPALPQLHSACRDPDAQVRRTAAESLSRIGSPDSVPHLAELLRDPSPAVRMAAAATLGTIGEAALPELLDALLRTDDQHTRDAASKALVAIGGLAVPGLLQAWRRAEGEVRMIVEEALNAIATPHALISLTSSDALT